ncbi:hypothetical protein OG21DRAFT_1483686 [Imleria badia]|nr:hypothetical protein OG21DRAFT_1483686 [Imleria badia]
MSEEGVVDIVTPDFARSWPFEQRERSDNGDGQARVNDINEEDLLSFWETSFVMLQLRLESLIRGIDEASVGIKSTIPRDRIFRFQTVPEARFVKPKDSVVNPSSPTTTNHFGLNTKNVIKPRLASLLLLMETVVYAAARTPPSPSGSTKARMVLSGLLVVDRGLHRIGRLYRQDDVFARRCRSVSLLARE